MALVETAQIVPIPVSHMVPNVEPILAPVVSTGDVITFTTPSGNAHILTEDASVVPIGNVYERVVHLHILRQLETLPIVKNQTAIHLNGTPASGKSALGRRLQQYVNKRMLQSGAKTRRVVIIDTDEIMEPIWLTISSPNLFLNAANDAMLKFFLEQPEDALIICCGVTDNVEVRKNDIWYHVPNIPWSRRLYLDVDMDTIVRQKFRRDIVDVVNSSEAEKFLTPDEPEELSFSRRLVEAQAKGDYDIYVKALGYQLRTPKDMFTELKNLIQLWIPLAVASDKAPKKRKRQN